MCSVVNSNALAKVAEIQRQKIADLEARLGESQRDVARQVQKFRDFVPPPPPTPTEREDALRRDCAAAYARIDELEQQMAHMNSLAESSGHTGLFRDLVFVNDMTSPMSRQLGDSTKRPWKP